MTPQQIKAMKMALEALEYALNKPMWNRPKMTEAIATIKEALAQPEQEPVAWRNAAIRVGEDLSSVGPDGYYDMTAQQWLDWAIEQEPRGKNSLAQPNEFNPDWDAMAVMVEEQQRMAKRIAELERENFAWRTKLGVRGYELQIEDLKAQSQMQPCAGRNCGSTNPNLHSAECFEDYERSTGMAQPEQPSVPWSAALESVWGEPEQEPVIGKWVLREVYFDEDGEPVMHRSPPQRTWVWLTKVERIELLESTHPNNRWSLLALCEAKLKEKNGV